MKKVLILFLAFFYQPAFSLDVKIGLEDKLDRLYITCNQDYKIITEDQVTLLELKEKQATLLRTSTATAKKLIIASKPLLASTDQKIKFICKEKCIWQIRDFRFEKSIKKFRGSLVILPRSKDFTLINELDIEDYLKGVVPSEMPVSWHQEAIKAQTLAARTYTIANLNRRKNLGYDLKSTVEDQVYKGFSQEDPRVNKLIKSTEGEILIDKNNLPINAFFSSEAGTSSASPYDVWFLDWKHYLLPQKFNDNSSAWQIVFSVEDLQKKFSDFNFDEINAVTLINRGQDGRVNQILVSGLQDKNLKHKLLTGEEFRHRLALRSTQFNINYSNNLITLTGKGFGHAIGLSQNGTQRVAQTGKTYQEILQTFYPGITFRKIK